MLQGSSVLENGSIRAVLAYAKLYLTHWNTVRKRPNDHPFLPVRESFSESSAFKFIVMENTLLNYVFRNVDTVPLAFFVNHVAFVCRSGWVDNFHFGVDYKT